MRYEIFLIYLFLIGCKTTDKEHKIKFPLSNKITEFQRSPLKNIKNRKSDEIKNEDFEFDTCIVNGLTLIEISQINNPYAMITIKNDTVVPKSDGFDEYVHLDFEDINKDGFKDILIYHLYQTYSTYLFNKVSNKFQHLENCYSPLQKINNTDFYYTYYAEGCSDSEWNSELYKLNDMKLFRMAHIYGMGCESDTVINPKRIEISKIKNDTTFMIIETLPYKKNIPAFADKWTFIKKYWTTNWKHFE